VTGPEGSRTAARIFYALAHELQPQVPQRRGAGGGPQPAGTSPRATTPGPAEPPAAPPMRALRTPRALTVPRQVLRQWLDAEAARQLEAAAASAASALEGVAASTLRNAAQGLR
jgi:hypothetical protein